MRYTLRKSEILRGKHNFQKVFNSGERIYNNLINSFYLIEKTDTKENKIVAGFLVNRKIKSAVIRNRCRRLMRESYRLNKNILNIQTKNFYNVSIIFYFKKIIEDKKIKLQQVADDIVNSLLRIKDEILRKDSI
ncbi:MAG: Ribonuclease P protein component [Ignavibacteriae bacterium]|nr:MAG: Ribonuclease P protein component [Ignavibacteriota bacterium]